MRRTADAGSVGTVAVWVRLWFDPIGDLEHLTEQPTLVGNFRAAAGDAERYRSEMAERYPGVRVTVDPLPDPPPARDLPAEQLWALTP